MVFLAGIQVAKSQMVWGQSYPQSCSHLHTVLSLFQGLTGDRQMGSTQNSWGTPPFSGAYTHLTLGTRMFISGSPKITSSLFPVSLSGQRAGRNEA